MSIPMGYIFKPRTAVSVGTQVSHTLWNCLCSATRPPSKGSRENPQPTTGTPSRPAVSEDGPAAGRLPGPALFRGVPLFVECGGDSVVAQAIAPEVAESPQVSPARSDRPPGVRRLLQIVTSTTLKPG
jgi:hypothetical protein